MRRAAGDAPEEALPISGKPPSVVARRNCTVAEKVKLSGMPETTPHPWRLAAIHSCNVVESRLSTSFLVASHSSGCSLAERNMKRITNFKPTGNAILSIDSGNTKWRRIDRRPLRIRTHAGAL